MITEHTWITANEPSMVHYALIGSGGTGDVHEVYDKRTGESFARKIVRLGGIVRQEDIENEARVVESLLSCRHQNVVHILRHDWLPNSFNRCLEVYISMHNQSEQSSLGVALPPKFDPKNAPVVCGPGCSSSQTFLNMWTIGLHIASGLQHLHAQKYVHRDLKPGNVLYSASDNTWKITDFGISAEATAQAARSTHHSRGTASYRAPELLLDKAHFSNKTDIWGLGCILHELATGRSPFQDDWRVRLYHLSPESLSLTLPRHQPFFQHHVQENILDLLNKDYLNRPSATRAKEMFENYCWFLENSSLYQIITDDNYPSYDQFHTAMFNRLHDTEGLGDLRSALLSSSPAIIAPQTTAITTQFQEMPAAEVCDTQFRTILNAIAHDSSNYWLWHSLGVTCLAYQQYSHGISLCKQGKRQYPSSRWPDIILSCIYARSGKARSAINKYIETFEGAEESDVWNYSRLFDENQNSRVRLVLETLKSPVLIELIQYHSPTQTNYLILRIHQQELKKLQQWPKRWLSQTTFADVASIDSLHDGAWAGRLEIIQNAIESNHDVNLPESSGLTSLHLAVWNRHGIIVTEILKATKAGVDRQDMDGRSPLHYATWNDDLEIMKKLIQAGASVHVTDNGGWTPLHWAANRGFSSSIQFLIYCGAEISARDNSGRTPLHRAATFNHVNAIRTMLDGGAKLSPRDQTDSAPLHWAAAMGQLEATSVLLERCADPMIPDGYGATPLHRSAKYGRLEVCKTLIEHGAEVSVKDVAGKTALHRAASRGHIDVMLFLIGAGANVNALDSKGRSPLQRCARKGHAMAIKSLISHGADVASVDSDGNNAYRAAVWSGRADAVLAFEVEVPNL